MAVETKLPIYRRFLYWLPVILLFISVLNEFDFNYFNYKYFSFNFPFILIYYWCLRRTQSLGYGYIFIAGLFNDVVIGFPLGLSSLTYLLICLFAAYLKYITIRPRLLNDWFFFLFTIMFVNSVNYFLLILFFSVEVDYYIIGGNILFTFLLYYIFANLFDIYFKLTFRVKDD